MSSVVLIAPPLSSKQQAGSFKTIANVMPPLGLAFIGATTEAAGFWTFIIDAIQARLTIEETVDRCIDCNPFIIGITATVLTIDAAQKLSRQLKKRQPHVRIVLGGVMVSSMPEICLKAGSFDCGVMGEGEHVFPQLCKQVISGKWRPLSLPGIVAPSDGTWQKTKRPSLIRLDDLPLPAWHLLPHPSDYRPMPAGYRRLPMAHMVTSRGCPYQCTYCDRSVFGNRFRSRSSNLIVDEMELLHKRYGAKEIKFYDDLFNISEKRVVAICREIRRRELDISWSCMCRADTMTEKMALEMQKAGCWQVDFGIESGSQKILDQMQKGLTVAQSKEGIKHVKSAGMRVRAYFIVGMPGETAKTLYDTQRFLLEMDIDVINLFALTLYPGNELFRQLKEQEKIKHRDFSTYTTIVDLKKHSFHYVPEGISEVEMKRFIRSTYRKFYLRLNYIWNRFLRIRTLDDLLFHAKSGLLILKI